MLEELRRHYCLEFSEITVNSMATPEPKFTFCGTFSGKDNISAARWIRKLEFELGPFKVNGAIPAQPLLSSIDLLLTDEAAKWAETNPDAVRILG